MKFEAKFHEGLVPEWEFMYINYRLLKLLNEPLLFYSKGPPFLSFSKWLIEVIMDSLEDNKLLITNLKYKDQVYIEMIQRHFD